MKKGNRSTFSGIKSAVIKGIQRIIPFAVCGGIFVSLSYIIDIFGAEDAVYGLGSTNPLAIISKSVGSLCFNLMLPVLSAFIAAEISKSSAFIAGLVGGFLAQQGSTLTLPYGDTTAVSGVLGAIGAGITAGLISKAFDFKRNGENADLSYSLRFFLSPLVSVIITSAIILCLNPFVGLLNTALSALLIFTREANPVLFGGILGFMASVDMGGAFNKAAFIFATAALTSGEYTVMASIMAASMTVPLSVALAGAVFRPKFTHREQVLCKANILFGLCSVPEGAIPIAAKSPVRVIPAMVSGAVVSSALSSGFGCTLLAPFGGVLLLPITGRPALFLLSVFTGTLVGAVALGLLKNEPEKEALYIKS